MSSRISFGSSFVCDFGIFVFAAVLLIEEAILQRNWSSAGVYAAMLVGLIGKTLFELTCGGTMFVESANFTPVPVAHIAGAVVGALVAIGQRCVSGSLSQQSQELRPACLALNKRDAWTTRRN